MKSNWFLNPMCLYHMQFTLGGIATICFKFNFQTDNQQTLRTHIQKCQGCQKIRNLLRNWKILIARSTIQPSLSKIQNRYWKTSKIEEKKKYLSIIGEFFTAQKHFSIWKLNFFNIFLTNRDDFFNGFWFYSSLAGCLTWQWVFLNFSINFWSFIFWHPWHPWVCIRSDCWKWNLKQNQAIPPSVHYQRSCMLCCCKFTSLFAIVSKYILQTYLRTALKKYISYFED